MLTLWGLKRRQHLVTMKITINSAQVDGELLINSKNMYQNDCFQQYTLLLWSMSTCKGSSNTPLHMGQTNSSSTSP